MDEFGAVLCRIWDPSEYSSALNKIRNSRNGNKPFDNDPTLSGNFFIYWKSHLSIGNTLLTEEAGGKALRINPEYKGLLLALMRFGRSCDDSKDALFRSQTWTDVEEYYGKIGGVACPPFLESAEPRIVNVAGTPVTDLSSYALLSKGKEITITGGPELCKLPILTPCIHRDRRAFLLRLDSKIRLPDGRVELSFGRGRPVVRPELIFGTNGEK
ncbi:hypothetical protein GOL33_17180 [Sinorhizobium medicae]|nr:hypothetical protein [Sinorhizobium medicae]